nr:MAG TPA: hypothetical protein [Caudoviricetes sp.]
MSFGGTSLDRGMIQTPSTTWLSGSPATWG